MDIRFYENFSKRPKSTKTPDSSVFSWGTTVRLKQDTSIYNPTFLMSSSVIKTFNFNYCLWDNKYYFVDDVIKGNNNVWEIQCSLDKLATLKNDIKNTSAYVKYSSSVVNRYIVDDRINFTKIQNIFTYDNDNFPAIDTTTWPCVIQYISKSDNDTMPTAYAVLSVGQMKKLGEYLMSDGLSESLSKQLDSVASSIVACKWYGLTIPKGTTNFNLSLANSDTSVTARHLTKGIETNKIHIIYTLQYDDFRNFDPYTKWVLFMYGYGYVEIPSDLMIYYNGNLPIIYTIDWYNGTITWSIEGLGKFDGVIAVNIPVAYSGINAMNTITNIASALAGAGTAISGALTGVAPLIASGATQAVASGINAFVSANTHTIGTQGASSGSMASVRGGQFTSGKPTLYRINLQTDGNLADINDTLGRPYQKVISLSGLSGYVQTVGACVSSNYPKYIVDEVNSLLDGGIYLE